MVGVGVTVVEYRAIMSAEYCVPVPVFRFWPKLTHPAARSVCDSWATCYITSLLQLVLSAQRFTQCIHTHMFKPIFHFVLKEGIHAHFVAIYLNFHNVNWQTVFRWRANKYIIVPNFFRTLCTKFYKNQPSLENIWQKYYSSLLFGTLCILLLLLSSSPSSVVTE